MPHLGLQKIGKREGGSQTRLIIQRSGRLGQRAQDIAIPGRNDLVIDRRANPLLANLEQPMPTFVKPFGDLSFSQAESIGQLPISYCPVQNILPVKVWIAIKSEGDGEEIIVVLGFELRLDGLAFPSVEPAFLAF